MSGKVDSKPKAAPSRPASKAPSRKSESAPAKDKSVEGKVAPKDRAEISREASQKESKPADTSKQISALQDNFGDKPAASKGRSLSDDRSVSGGENCLDRAASQAKNDDQALFLKDGQNKDGNNAGHVVLQRDGRIVDPNTPDKNYENFEAYKAANPQYNEILGQTSGENLKRIVDAQSPAEREQAIQQAGLESIKNEKFADKTGASQPTAVQNATGPSRSQVESMSAFSTTAEEVAKAKGEVAALDTKMARGLAPVAAGMTNEQILAYQQAYQNEPANAAKYAAVQDGLDKFTPQFQGEKGAALADTVANSPSFANQVLENAQLAVTNPRPGGGIDRTQAILDWGRQNWDSFSDEFRSKWNENVVSPSMAQLLADSNERGATFPEALERLKPYTEGFKDQHSVREALQDMDAVNRNPKLADQKLGEWLEGGPAWKRNMAGSLAVTAALSAHNDFKNEDYLSMGANLAKFGENGLDVMRSGLKATTMASKIAGRMVPVLGLTAASLSLANNAQKLNAGEPGALAGCVGDTLSVVGQAAMVAGAGTSATGAGAIAGVPLIALGEFANGLGTLISVGGELYNRSQQDPKLWGEAQTRMNGVLGSETSSALWNNYKTVGLLNSYGVPPESIQNYVSSPSQLTQPLTQVTAQLYQDQAAHRAQAGTAALPFETLVARMQSLSPEDQERLFKYCSYGLSSDRAQHMAHVGASSEALRALEQELFPSASGGAI